MLFRNKLIEYKEIPEKIPEFPEIYKKSPEIPELSKWFGMAISNSNHAWATPYLSPTFLLLFTSLLLELSQHAACCCCYNNENHDNYPPFSRRKMTVHISAPR
jgi:hypothetical protein